MKKFFLLFILVLVAASCKHSDDDWDVATSKYPIALTTFTNKNFRIYIADNFDLDDDGYLSQSEIEAVTEIGFTYHENGSLEGIKIFYNLQKLYCWNNQLITLDVSGLKNLERLECYGNKLTSLDVSGLKNLKYLDCSRNKLTSLDVSGNDNLQELYCSNNQLTFLDVSGKDNLQTLFSEDNKLTSLNVSGVKKLKFLLCYNNKLTSLDVSGSDNLQFLSCSRNNLTSLDVSGKDNLQELYCNDNPNLSELRVNSSIKGKLELGYRNTKILNYDNIIWVE